MFVRPNPEVVDPSIGAAIQAAVTRSIGSLTDNLTQVIESRLTDFAKRFSEENSSSVEQRETTLLIAFHIYSCCQSVCSSFGSATPHATTLFCLT